MKIGIVTLPLHTNYGGILQAWALQTVLERMGHDASHVFRHLLGPFVLYEGLTDAEVRAIQQYTDRFVNRYIRCDETPVAEIRPDRYDAFVVGSDQIWRHFYTTALCGDWKVAFLDFAADWNVRRVAYAPSFGLDRWEAPESDIPLCAALLRKFDAVSCREAAGVKLCRDVLGVDAELVIDPTMLLARDDYAALIDAEETASLPGDLMTYVLDRTPEKQRLIEAFAARDDLVPFSANARPEDCSAPVAERIQPPLEQWLKGFRDAKAIITDSFHATVFSILFGKPFVVTGNPDRGLSRLESLLRLLGLEDHLAVNADDFDPNRDYSVPDSAYERLAALREKGLDYLRRALA